jgi:diacylglycerol kinase family enzyme
MAAERSEPPGDETTLVLVNTAAGLASAAAALARLSAACERRDLAVRVRAVSPDRLEDEIAAAAARGDAMLGVSGGDGTLLTAARVLAGRGTALAPFPGGTLNHFARRLGIPDFEAAADALLRGEPSDAPVGVVDDEVFLNTATFGFYAGVVRRRERLRPWIRKWPGAAVAFLEMLLRMRRFDVVLDVEGERLQRKTPLVWVGMGWGSFPRVVEARERRSRPDLEIVVLRPRSRLGMLRLLRRLAVHFFRGERPIDDPGLEVLHARSVLIRGPRRISATLDGEVRDLQAPLFLGVVDGALRVVVPDDE